MLLNNLSSNFNIPDLPVIHNHQHLDTDISRYNAVRLDNISDEKDDTNNHIFFKLYDPHHFLLSIPTVSTIEKYNLENVSKYNTILYFFIHITLRSDCSSLIIPVSRISQSDMILNTDTF
jgi:hypothetical protein